MEDLREKSMSTCNHAGIPEFTFVPKEYPFVVTNSETISIEPQTTSCDLIIVKSDGTYVFNPKDDVTPLESVRLVQWMITHHNSFYSVNFDFLEKYNLWRHFDKR